MHHQMSLLTLSAPIIDTFTAIAAMFACCEIGQRTSNMFEEICDEFGKFNWYRFPNEINRLLPVILLEVQEPVEFEVFGSITASRVLLRKVNLIDSFKISTKKNNG